ncbi:MAG: ABC transporter ATP-binding protein [Anaerolineales bacterium]|nr:ABC transporter ATP-binding protein [Anaerolineales bacterium]
MEQGLDLNVDMQGITKRFPGVVANDNVDFAVREGEIHALLGENGAGKSTLMNILSGLYQPTEGRMFIRGEEVEFHSPKDAIRHGIGMVHQHFMLVPAQTVSENLVLGQSDPRFIVNKRKLDERFRKLSIDYGLEVPPEALIWQLTVGEQQRVEILKMLYHGAKTLIMDEPTAVLTPQEVDTLFVTLRNMVKTGHTVIFISHKLDEVISIATRVTVLRRGKVSAQVDTKDTNKAELARLMVGREVLFRVEKKPAEVRDVLLSVRDLTCRNDRGLLALRGVNLNVRGGEILGIAGVAGNGQNELAEVITGLRAAETGQVKLGGVDVTNKPPTTQIDQGMAYIPADRGRVGSAPNLSIAENMILKNYRHPPVGSGWRISLGEMNEQATRLVEEFDIATPDSGTQARLLSGGNLQKLILARELSSNPKAIIAESPSRGLDVGATEAVHKRLVRERDLGAAVLLISEDLDELLSLSDRIVVIYEGEIIGEVPPDEDRIDDIGLMMAGTTDGRANADSN